MSRLRHNLPLFSEKDYRWFMRTIHNSLAFDQSEVGAFRLRCIELLDSHGFTAVHAAFPNVSRASLYRWRQRYYAAEQKPLSLRPRSTRPTHVRTMHVDAGILLFLKALRSKYPYLSKYKLQPFLALYCTEHSLPSYSASWIGKVISRYHLFFGVRKAVKRHHPSRRGLTRIKRCPKEKEVTLGYLQLDGVIIYHAGARYCFLSAVEVKTRQAWVYRVHTISSTFTKTFLTDIMTSVPYPIHTIQTDNGSEFFGLFEDTIKELALTHLRSYPHTPKTQAYIERFNRTFQEEWFAYQVGEGATASELDHSLTNWLTFYNTQRPHQSLNYTTPQQALNQLQSSKGDTKSLICA